jgi:hypothetical protein
MTIDEAIDKFSSIGIASKIIDENSCRMIGGRLQETATDFNVYSDAFSLYKEENIWILITPGVGQFSMIEKYETFDKAVDKICEFYSEP